MPSVRSGTCVFALALTLLAGAANAQKLQTATIATWRGAPPAVPLNVDLDLVLHLQGTGEPLTVAAEVVPSPGVEVVSGSGWSGLLGRGQQADVPVTVRVVAPGEWSIGARVTARSSELTEVSGAVLNVVAADGVARLGSETPALMRMAAARVPADLERLGIGVERGGVTAPAGRAGLGIPTTVGGTVTYKAPEGGSFPVRRAYVEITDAGGAVLATTATNDSGQYSAAVSAASVQVTVYSRDFDNIRVVVFPLGQPGQRYQLRSAITPVAAATTLVDLTTAPTVRGTPGAPSTDSISARAFATYDAMLTYWFQATALIGRDMQKALANFPESTAPGAQCGTSCYANNQQMYILREDAFDWDVLGHEFFHFTTDRGAARPIDTSGGGFHNGGSAIGQDTRGNGTGHIRTRDEGMRLAWSEGLATAMSLMMQQQPPSSFPFPALLNMGDAAYQDTEDGNANLNAESPTRSEGFGSENSVIGLLWDLYDSAQDTSGSAKDGLGGATGAVLWGAINGVLPGSPMDRVDRFWAGLTQFFGVTSATTLQFGPIFALNNMAPVTTGPADNSSVGGTTAPTFTWTLNGDPSTSHRNNHLFLVFSRDHFQSHIVPLEVPTLAATSYKPTDTEWASVQAGGNPGDVYEWFVAAERQDAPSIPQGWYWYSDIRKVIPRSIEATITWSPLGADVDLHLSNPSGTDIAYYNRTTSWGFLDRDCISTCTQEILSVTSLPLPGSYRLWVHYYSDRGKGPATVHAVVRSGSQILSDTTFVLSATGAQQSLGVVAVAPVRNGPTTATDAATPDPARELTTAELAMLPAKPK